MTPLLYRIPTFLLLWLLPLTASAYALPKFQRAQLLKPQHIEVNAGLSGGDDQWSLLGIGRMGLSEEYEAKLGLGTVLLGDELGFETAFGIKKYLDLAAAEKQAFQLSAVGDLSLTKAGLNLVMGIDPALVGERRFTVSEDKVFFLSLGLGLTYTLIDVSGEVNESNVGILATLGSGLDITEKWRGLLELSFRDGVKRLAIGASTHF